MTDRWKSVGDGQGGVFQSSMPTGRNAARPQGRTFRGVVIAVYSYDSADGLEAFGGQPTYNGIYCDVLCYGRWNGVFRRVLWTSDRQGMHEGSIDLPRATTLDISGDLDAKISNPASLDGDHVIIGFLEDDYSQPYIQRFIPHPSSDIGNDGKPCGQRMRVKEADGHPRFQKHRGAFWGVDDKGNFFIDLTAAHAGAYEDDGKEPAAPEDGNTGNVTVRTQAMTTLTLILGANHTITLTETDGKIDIVNTGDTELKTDGAVKIGTGASHKIIHGDTYQTDQTAKNAKTSAAHAAYGAHFTGFTALAAALTAAGAAPPGASEVIMIPTLWAAILAFANGLAATATSASPLATQAAAGINTYDSAVPNQLSPDVTSK